ncbi:MAG: PilW family protein [Halothiobacillaceae bacterium]
MKTITPAQYSKHAGFSIVELLIGLTIGLLLLAGVIAIFISTQQAGRTTDSLSRIQENARMAFELMARDVREAGGNPCQNNNPVANVLAGNAAWRNWQGGLMGYDTDAAFNAAFPTIGTGNNATQHITDTHAITVMGAVSPSATVTASAPAASTITINAAAGYAAGDILMACDFNQTSIFQASAVAGAVITHAANAGAPGNVTASLGLPIPTPYSYGANAQLARFQSVTWYIGATGRNDNRGAPINALFRTVNGGTPQEMIEGVDTMQLTFLVPPGPAYIFPTTLAQWQSVTAANITLTLSGSDAGTTTDNQNNARLQRTLNQTVSLRSRLP